MVEIKNFFNALFTSKFFKKVIAYALLIWFIYLSSNFIGIFLLTFIFAYLFLSLWEFLKIKIDNIFISLCQKDSNILFLKKLFSLNLIVIILYIIFIGFIIFILSDMLPKLITELSEITNNIPFLREQILTLTQSLSELNQNYSEIGGTISQVVSERDYDVLVNIIDRLKSASVVFFQILLALILSFVFIVDRKKLRKYLWWVKKSNFKFLYVEYKTILEKIANSFGLILKAQWMIAMINAFLTVLWLLIIGYIYTGVFFPFILTVWLIVFLFGFIPVLWVFISSVPIIIIAYNFVWGINSVIAVSTLIIMIHMIEAYYLNPKIVSSYLELPVSLTFVILIISEHLFWFAGLLIGVSLFYFLIWLLKDVDKAIKKTKKKVNTLE